MPLAKLLAAVALGVAAALIVGCASTQPTASMAASIDRGQRLALANCSSCHAIGLTGDSHHPMAPPFRTLSEKYPITDLDEAFAEGVLVGHRDMPEFRLTPAQIEDLTNYLQSVQDRGRG